MKINHTRLKNNRLTYNLSIGQKQMCFRQSSPVDEFYREEMLDIAHANTDKKCVSICNPLYLLLNQQRIEKKGSMALEEWLAGFDLKKISSLDELRSKCTDEDLCKMIKSRHLQAPAEILSWMRYMRDNMDQFNVELKAVIDEQSKTDGSTVPSDESKTE